VILASAVYRSERNLSGSFINCFVACSAFPLFRSGKKNQGVPTLREAHLPQRLPPLRRAAYRWKALDKSFPMRQILLMSYLPSSLKLCCVQLGTVGSTQGLNHKGLGYKAGEYV
jgi:hypothetical protein